MIEVRADPDEADWVIILRRIGPQVRGTFSASGTEWDEFVAAVKAGKFDNLEAMGT